jgi:hypothetical protein
MTLNYQKRKNTELFKSLEQSKTLFLSQTQNYIPIYSRFFSLNETNYNNINLNHQWYITSINEREKDQVCFPCKIKNTATEKSKTKDIFFKLAPLLDPYKYLIGKYKLSDDLFDLPSLTESTKINSKLLDVNNSAYVDGFFVFLTSCLNEHSNFIHGINYYGSFLSIKREYEINIADDLDYLTNSDFFVKNKGVLFQVEDYQHLYQEEPIKKKPIKISSFSSDISIGALDPELELFPDPFDESLFEAEELTSTLVDLTNVNLLELEENPNNLRSTSIRTSSTCSSRTSHTLSNAEEYDNVGEENHSFEPEGECEHDGGDGEDVWEDTSTSSQSREEDLEIMATIPKFPVQVIAMEHCEDTLDNLILDGLTTEEWFSALMQIIMTLITYQKVYSFTHNDLHTNNVMYIKTSQKFIYYKYNGVVYKVPTHGRIFKIIDFGRSIYKFQGKVFCSDSFQNGNDAASQYNTEPYFNDKKPRLEPNFSFDLCRLACSIFDYLIMDLAELKTMSSWEDPVKRIIVEWCLDDNGVNLLYKNNGEDRYPDFKLYKMISRFVHKHTPEAQLLRPEFQQFSVFKGDPPKEESVIDIDKY